MSKLFKFKSFDIEEAEAIANAGIEGRSLWKWADFEEYKQLSKDELMVQLQEFGENLVAAGPNGEFCFLKLLNDSADNMPSDARVDFMYKPTYVATAVYIFAYTKYPEIFEDPKRCRWFKGLLSASQGRRLMGHGYDGETELLNALLLFAKAGYKDFVKVAPGYAGCFCAMLSDYFIKLEHNVDICRKKGKPYCVRGFGPVIVDRLAKEILSIA